MSERPAEAKSSGPSKTVSQWLAAWKALGLSVKGHDVIKDRSNLDKALFGLWAIRKAAGEHGKVVSARNLSSFLYEAFEINVHGRSLENVLQSDPAKGRVLRVRGKGYQVQPPGIGHVGSFPGLARYLCRLILLLTTTQEPRIEDPT